MDEPTSTPHDVPTAAELVEAVREWIERDVMASADGRLKFHARVATNVLAMVEREMELGGDHARAHAERLAQLGVSSDAELSAAIRSGELDVDPAALRSALLDSVVDKLTVANPRYLER